MTLQTTTPAVQQKIGYRYVKYTFFKVDPAWRKLSSEDRESSKKQFLSSLNQSGDKIRPRSYSLVGTRGDVDFMLWTITDSLETLREGACWLEVSLRLSLHEKERMVQRAVRGEKENNERPRAIRPKISISYNTHIVLFRHRRLRVYPVVRNRSSRRLPQPGDGSENHRSEQVHSPGDSYFHLPQCSARENARHARAIIQETKSSSID